MNILQLFRMGYRRCLDGSWGDGCLHNQVRVCIRCYRKSSKNTRRSYTYFWNRGMIYNSDRKRQSSVAYSIPLMQSLTLKYLFLAFRVWRRRYFQSPRQRHYQENSGSWWRLWSSQCKWFRLTVYICTIISLFV